MSDIVQRLRRKTVAGQPVFPTPLDIDAANEIERLLALSQTAKILRTVSRPPLQFICSLCGEPVHDGDCAAMGGGT